MNPLTPSEREELRHATLAELVAAYPVPRAERAVAARVKGAVMFHVPPEEHAAALEFLREKALVESTLDALGSTKWWKATAAGVLARERGSIS